MILNSAGKVHHAFGIWIIENFEQSMFGVTTQAEKSFQTALCHKFSKEGIVLT
jgi:hypothetical protein